MTITLRPLATALLLLLAVAAPAAAGSPVGVGDLEVSGAWARASIGTSRPGAAYFAVTNTGDAPDSLVAIASPAAAMPMIHATAVSDAGVARMEPVPTLEIPPGETVTLAPGGMHVMLMNLSAPLVEGQTLPLTLTFEKAGTVEIAAPILAIAAKGPPAE